MDDDETVPIDQELYDIVTHHGRDYQQHALTAGIYFEPIDEYEIERLERMHRVIEKACDDQLIVPPLSYPGRVLDCGFGAAHWAVDVALRHPTCKVTGIDISPLMIPDELPDNVDPQVDDLNQSPSFTFPANHFDIVHSQLVAGGIHANHWCGYIQDIHKIVRPGGWCQMVELYFNAQSDNGSLTHNHGLMRWSRKYLDSVQPFKNPRAALQLENWVRSAGFIDVECRVIKLPMCAWSHHRREREIGEINKDNVSRMLASLALYPFTEFLHMSIVDAQLLIAQARSEAANPQYKPYFPLYVCIGRKRR